MLACPAPWRALDLSASALRPFGVGPDAGASPRHCALLAAASAAARGGAESIDLSGYCTTTYGLSSRMVWRVIVDAARANAASLRAINVTDWGEHISLETVNELLAAAPGLATLHADVACDSVESARAALDNAGGPLASLRVRSLQFYSGSEHTWPEDASRFVATVAELGPGHPGGGLKGVGLECANLFLTLHESDAAAAAVTTQSFCEAIGATAVRCGLESLSITSDVLLPPQLLPQLTRALRHGTLRSLECERHADEELDELMVDELMEFIGDCSEAAARDFCDALRASRLERLSLADVGFWRRPARGAAVLAAVTAHPTLQQLRLWGNHFPGGHPYFTGRHDRSRPAGDAIASLLAANSPVLRDLSVSENALGLTSLVLVVAALRRNTHLERLFFQQRGVYGLEEEALSKEFVAAHVLPAVRRCTSLLEVSYDSHERRPADKEVQAILEERRRTGGLRPAA